ncbi:hypothetical protein U8527_19745 [Kordia algicida OT-1]|uniref:Uncharacterized protein n=1 Tax=Kordia algicida OT-1 TaxID=391587 RepID=A9DK22_9FLAO|nr:hypothetical protein [Kordia algicida]EDP98243.1 hypothetical protein KAOT1_13537 [Kordia algicida OT-1]
MLENISNLGTALSKKEQRQITGGVFINNEADCLRCGGEWDAPFCTLPSNTPCQ